MGVGGGDIAALEPLAVGVFGLTGSFASALPFAERSAAAETEGRRRFRMNRCDGLELLPLDADSPEACVRAEGLDGGSNALVSRDDTEDARGLRNMK